MGVPTTDLRLTALRRTYEPPPRPGRPMPRVHWERLLTASYWLDAAICSVVLAGLSGMVASWLIEPVLILTLVVMLVGGLGQPISARYSATHRWR